MIRCDEIKFNTIYSVCFGCQLLFIQVWLKTKLCFLGSCVFLPAFLLVSFYQSHINREVVQCFHPSPLIILIDQLHGDISSSSSLILFSFGAIFILLEGFIISIDALVSQLVFEDIYYISASVLNVILFMFSCLLLILMALKMRKRLCIYSYKNYFVSQELTYYSFAETAHQGT